MAGNDIEILDVFSHQFSSAVGNVFMACSMCAVTADLVVLVPGIRYREQVAFRTHCLVECCIEYEDMLDIRKSLLEGVVADEMRVVMQRRKLAEFINFRDDIFIDLD